jgi:putative NADH-flavin reductase
MKIAVFGATGPTGLEIIQCALKESHTLKCLVRTPAKLDAWKEDPNVIIVPGDARNPADISSCLDSCDSTIVCLGARPGSSDGGVCSNAQKLINDAILQQHRSIKRLVCVSSVGVRDSYNDLGFFQKIFVNTIIRAEIADKAIQEQHIEEDLKQAVKWSIVRPGGLTKGPFTGKYRVGEHIGGSVVSRADVAHFVVTDCLVNDERIFKCWNQFT